MHSPTRRALLVLLMGVVMFAVVQPSQAEGPVARRYSLMLPLIARDGGPNPVPYPSGTRSGIPDLDSVLVALEADSPQQLKDVFEPTPEPCALNPRPMDTHPRCSEGVPPGTLVPVFRAAGCDAMTSDHIEASLQYLWKNPRPVLAIYRNPTDAYAWLPAADYAVIVLQGAGPLNVDPLAEGRPAVVRVKNGHVNGILFGCGHTFDQLTAGVDASRFVLPPR